MSISAIAQSWKEPVISLCSSGESVSRHLRLEKHVLCVMRDWQDLIETTRSAMPRSPRVFSHRSFSACEVNIQNLMLDVCSG